MIILWTTQFPVAYSPKENCRGTSMELLDSVLYYKHAQLFHIASLGSGLGTRLHVSSFLHLLIGNALAR